MTAHPDASADTLLALAPGKIVGSRYEIQSVLGEGASGIVYVATRKPDGERVALKVIHRHLHNNRQIFGRFHREAEILKRLEGEHLVKLLDFVEDGGLLCIALEYVEGVSLESMLAEKRPMPIDEATEITLQVCAALGVAHAAGIVHRDLKPGNVMIENPTADDAGLRVRVLDFGLAKVVHGERMVTGLTEQDMIFGTPEYMAPEQARGDEVDLRCDLYSAGVMLYEMVVGDVPFHGRTPIGAMTAHLTEPTPRPRSVKPNDGISPALEAVIVRALAKNPADRYPSARALAEALAAARRDALVIAPESAAATAIDIGDTDLSVTHDARAAKTPPSASRGGGPALAPLELAKTLPVVLPARRSDEPCVPAAAAESRWFWTVVAIVAAAIGVAIGVFIGSR